MGSETGNAAAAFWPGAESDEILMDAVFILECAAPPDLHAGRFLPPTPVRVMVNHPLEDRGRVFSSDSMTGRFRNLPPSLLLQHIPSGETMKKMKARCGEIAGRSVPDVIRPGLQDLDAEYQSEIRRLQKRGELHQAARSRDVHRLQAEKGILESAIRSARLRLDAWRLIFRFRSGRPFE